MLLVLVILMHFVTFTSHGSHKYLLKKSNFLPTISPNLSRNAGSFFSFELLKSMDMYRLQVINCRSQSSRGRTLKSLSGGEFVFSLVVGEVQKSKDCRKSIASYGRRIHVQGTSQDFGRGLMHAVSRYFVDAHG